MNNQELCEILGLTELTDKKSIKKAYAKQAALHHPEEDPEAFQRLQTAYHMALNIVEKQNKFVIYSDHSFVTQDSHPQQKTKDDENSEADAQQNLSKDEWFEDDIDSEAEEPHYLTTEELLEAITHNVKHRDLAGLLNVLETGMSDSLKKDASFLEELTQKLLATDRISFTSRKILIEAFALQTAPLSSAQENLLQAIQKDVLPNESTRLSCVKDADYLVEKWKLLCNQRYEDEEAWLSFLRQQSWTKEEPTPDTIRQILELERIKMHSHTKISANKIVSFLKIREHMAQDVDQIYERLMNILEKDAMQEEGYQIWKRITYPQVTRFSAFSFSRHSLKEWRDWLEKEKPDADDVELTMLLAKKAKPHYYPKSIQKELLHYFHLDESASYAKQELKKAILEIPPSQRKIWHRRLMMILIGIVVLVLAILDLQATADKRREDLEQEEKMNEFIDEQREEQRKKNDEFIDSLNDYVEDKDEDALLNSIKDHTRHKNDD